MNKKPALSSGWRGFFEAYTKLNPRGLLPSVKVAVQIYFELRLVSTLKGTVMKEFVLVAEFEITVPSNYDAALCIAQFKQAHPCDNRRTFYDKNITDENFSNPSRVLRPSEKLRVCAFKQDACGITDSGKITSSKERMNYLASKQMNLYPSAQGALQVFEYRHFELPTGYWFASFDEEDRLPLMDGVRKMMYGRRSLDGPVELRLGSFRISWPTGILFFGFSEIK